VQDWNQFSRQKGDVDFFTNYFPFTLCACVGQGVPVNARANLVILVNVKSLAIIGSENSFSLYTVHLLLSLFICIWLEQSSCEMQIGIY
jgi:hypothetical protein